MHAVCMSVCDCTCRAAAQEKFFALLERRLSASAFLVSAEPTVADFFGVVAFECYIKSFGAIDAAKFPLLSAWWTEAVPAVPAVAKMRSSGVPVVWF